MTIYDDYIKYCDQYRKQYGEQTVVLIQVGDFFELYGVQNDDECLGADMYKVGELCNLIVTRKNKSILENNRQNPLMAGFPLYALPKHSQTLIDNGYTVVVIRQVTPPPNVQRQVTEILSPSMNITPSTSDGNYLVTYFWDTNVVGVSGLDVSTGETFTYEVSGSLIFDEAYRILQTYQPKEVIILGDLPPNQCRHIEDVLNTDSIQRVFHMRWGQYKDETKKIVYQNKVLCKVYAEQLQATSLEPSELVGIDRYEYARMAFINMLIFAYEHNCNIVEKLQLPRLLHNEAHLTLEYNSAVQLNIISCFPGDKPLINILNKCCTSFGGRLFRQRLLCPSRQPCELQKRYDRIQQLMDTQRVMPLRRLLKHIGDIERMVRKMELSTLSPLEFYNFHSSLNYALDVATCDENVEVSNIISFVKSQYNQILLLEECAKYTMTDVKSNLFLEGVYGDIDIVMHELSCAHATINNIANGITSLDQGEACLCRVENNDRDGYFLQITKKRWELAKTRANKVGDVLLCEMHAKPISSGSNILRLTCESVDKASDTIMSSQRRLSSIVIEKYKEFLTRFASECGQHIRTVVAYIADTDVAANNAFIAQENAYCKPRLSCESGDGMSFLDVTCLRHPIIEQLNKKTAYVSNDVHFKSTGMLLYGINAAGKSSLMKAVGICLVMAQAGMYVAASSMTFSPYHHIFTRITSMDNIYRGMSTFVVEMAELRNILLRADDHSLVIGDELCAGTESVSAVAIVAAGVKSLLDRRASFVFATHLHELTDIPLIKEADRLDIYHMHIETDPDTGKIIYDRKLRRGPGSKLYGLEVCQSLGMPDDFVQMAHQVRRGNDELVRNKWSRYNKSVCVDTCLVCKNNRACEVHHIDYQHTSLNGFTMEGVRLNNASNLVPLCKECHLEEHHGNLKIYGYRDTTMGTELHYERQTQPVKTHHISFDEVVVALHKKYKYSSPQWYLKTAKGWRKCKVDTITKEACKSYKYTLNDEEVESLKQRLVCPSS